MRAALKKKWIAALRSGKYKQGKGSLYNPERREYCCIGVLGRCADLRYLGDRGYLFAATEIAATGVSQTEQRHLASLNDQGCTFKQIATWIEKNL